MRRFNSRIRSAASASPLFHGRTSAIAVARPRSFARLTIRWRFAAASSTARPWTTSLIPPWITIAAAPSTAASNRAAISSVRSPLTPWFRKVSVGCARSTQNGHWLSGFVAPLSARTSGSGSQPGAPAVIESPRAATTVRDELKPSARRVQRDGGANQRLQRLRVDLVALVDVDRAPRVALEARVEELRRIVQRRALREGELHDVLVRLTGADDPVVLPHRNAAPLPRLLHVRIGLLDQLADASERLAAPVVEVGNALI